jgi:hypothetical protein
MARFSNKIESLKYADREHKTIEILYKNGESINSYYIEVDYNNQDFLDLLKEYSIEDIEDQTKAYYDNINTRKQVVVQSWIEQAQAVLDKQDKERYELFEKYKKEQLRILEAEVENRLLDADKYKEKQQEYLDQQAEQRFKEAELYVETREKQVKSDLLSKFRQPISSSAQYTPEKVVKYMIDNFEDEDTVFKTKLEIFNLSEVKNSKDREMKMKVRKAKTVPEIFAAYHDIQCNHS